MQLSTFAVKNLATTGAARVRNLFSASGDTLYLHATGSDTAPQCRNIHVARWTMPPAVPARGYENICLVDFENLRDLRRLHRTSSNIVPHLRLKISPSRCGSSLFINRSISRERSHVY